MTLVLRYMTMNDIPQVVNIDKWSFSTPWSARTYSYEVTESEYSHMVVLEHVVEAAPVRRGFRRGVQRLLQSLSTPVVPANRLFAYGGLWRVMEEAHISTIASHADFRGRGYGELSLLSMMRRGMTLGADFVALEVRVSNSIAQNLYLKHGFRVQGVKHHYYRDDGEDAYDMRLYYTQAVCGQIEASYAELRRRHAFIDRYSDQAVQS